MKRVQALVSGKKKQCTKLPKPTVKEKRFSSSPDVNSSRHRTNSQEDTGTIPDNNGGSKEVAPEVTMLPPSNTVTGETITTISTESPSSPKTSKIPGAAPKKNSRDGGGWLSRKGPPRQEKPRVSKSESFSKKSPKEKQKKDLDSKKADDTKNKKKSGSKSDQKMASSGEAGFVTENRYTDRSREIERTELISEDSKPSSSPTDKTPLQAAKADVSQLKVQEGTAVKEPRLQNTTESGPQRANDRNADSPQQTQASDNQVVISQSQNTQPLHGILKDSSSSSINESNNSIHRNVLYNGSDNVYSAQPQTREHVPSRNSQPVRAESFRERPTQYQQPPYGSLPRNARSITPDGAYNYGSFPRRSHLTAPKQGNVMYNGPQEWGSLSRKAESDFVYPIGNIEGDRSSGRRDNTAINARRNAYGITGYSNDYYGIVGSNYQVHRSNAAGYDPRGSGYRLDRNGISASNYNSDTETMRYNRDDGYGRGLRAGSVPLGYESDSGAYGVVVNGQPRFGSIPRNYEVRPDMVDGSGQGLRVHPDDEQYRAGPGKRPIPRRHTVGTSSNRMDYKNSETERKREAFMQLLAQRYPQYADRIQGAAVSHSTPVSHLPDKPSRSREGQRRRTALVAYNPNVTGNSLEYDDIGNMTDAEVSSFHRGGFSRTSLPIVRSASTSLERPLGLVFLVYGDQTKKALLPNEITTLDTVRALFVRAFPDLTLDSLEENHRKKIYLLDPATNIYFQLEDLTDIKDRSVLKIHETDNDQPQKVKERQEVRGRTVQMTRSHSGQPYGEVGAPHNEMLIKSQSLLPQHSNNYQEMMQEQRFLWERERRSRSRTPEPPERSQRSMPSGSTNQRFSHSPDRLPTPERLHLNPIPENRQIPLGHARQDNYYENVGPGFYRGHNPSDAGFQRSLSHRIPHTDRDGKDLSRSHSVTPVDDTAKNRIEKMEQQLANLTAWVHYQKDSTRQDAIPAPRSLGRTASDSSDTFPASSASSKSLYMTK